MNLGSNVSRELERRLKLKKRSSRNRGHYYFDEVEGFKQRMKLVRDKRERKIGF